MRLKNKRIVVIGGTSGIGKGIIEKFSGEGANIIFCGRSLEKGIDIEKNNVHTKFFACDVKSREKIRDFFQKAINYLGGLDIAVNNAGISGEITPFHLTGSDEFHEIMQTNFYSIWYCMQEEINSILSTGVHGSIVNIASTSGLKGNGLGLAPYASSKHAVIGLTKSTALEYAKDNIRINAICPGFIDTPMTDKANEMYPKLKRKIPAMHPMGRIGTVDEVSNAALYLCSDESSFSTGSCIVVDGGLTI